MVVPCWLENGFLGVVDRIYACIPQRRPSLKQLRHVRIVSHRGAHDKAHLENTFEAFDQALDLGLWGVELDIRWTKDLVPVVHHDACCNRVFKKDIMIGEINFADLREAIPAIPSLEEVAHRYGRKIHLMIEIKEEPYPDPAKQNVALEQALSSIKPIEDYCFISLEPSMFDYVKFAPSETFYPVAAILSKSFAQLCLEKNYGGLLGHYFFVGDHLVNELQTNNKQIGLGFVSSKNSLYRELNRGIDWVYTDNPKKMLKIRAKCLSAER